MKVVHKNSQEENSKKDKVIYLPMPNCPLCKNSDDIKHLKFKIPKMFTFGKISLGTRFDYFSCQVCGVLFQDVRDIKKEDGIKIKYRE